MAQMIEQTAEKRSRKNNKKATYLIAEESVVSLDATLSNLSSNLNGLEEEDARERLLETGPNQVAHEKVPPALVQLISAFNNPFIFVLMVLAAISFFTDYWLPLQRGEETDLIGVIII